MRRILAIAVGIGSGCLLLAAAAMADPALSGYGEIGGGIGAASRSDAESGCSEVLIWPPPSCGELMTHDSSIPEDLSALINISVSLGAGFDLQFDAEGKKIYMGAMPLRHGTGYTHSSAATKYGLGLHLDWADDDYRLGGLVSVGNSDLIYQKNNRLVSGGLEAARYFDRVTLFLQAIYSRSVQGVFSASGLNSTYFYSGGRYFTDDNLMFEADFGVGSAHGNEHSSWEDMAYFGPITGFDDGHLSGNTVQWQVKGEYRLNSLPLGPVDKPEPNFD